MKFSVNQLIPATSEPTIYLAKDNWNDWYTWQTMYTVMVFMPDGSSHRLGSVKIGQRGMAEGNASTRLPETFESLGQSYFSIGQDENYYETLVSLGDSFRSIYLSAMRDIAFAPAIYGEFATERVMSESLLRDINFQRRERFSRLAQGHAALTSYSFEYAFPNDPKALTPAPILSFKVKPNATPASNIHVLIGRNGVGKTRCFDLLARTFLQIPAEDQEQLTGQLKASADVFSGSSTDPGFAGLVTVSFSAFDSKGPLVGSTAAKKRYAYVGLVHSEPKISDRVTVQTTAPRLKSSAELSKEFSESVMVCRDGVRRLRWQKALRVLEADPLFAEANVSSLADDAPNEVQSRANSLFRNLSSGHAVVLLSTTRLVEFVEERSLVLIDEPESHLHPPLLAAFIRALSDLLIDRNGVAIIATHSPVVLQEVPRLCVWKINRAGREIRADRPELETFGENVGVLTREIFGLEVTQTGFHKLISEAALTRDYDEIISHFSNQLGAEGRALARALSITSPNTTLDDVD